MTLKEKPLEEMTLKEFRLVNGLNQTEMLDKCGLSRALYSGMELGTKTPSVNVIKRIAENMEQSPELILRIYLNTEKEFSNV